MKLKLSLLNVLCDKSSVMGNSLYLLMESGGCQNKSKGRFYILPFQVSLLDSFAVQLLVCLNQILGKITIIKVVLQL